MAEDKFEHWTMNLKDTQIITKLNSWFVMSSRNIINNTYILMMQ